MITEGETAIPLETTRRAFRNQEKSKQRSAIVILKSLEVLKKWLFGILAIISSSKNSIFIRNSEFSQIWKVTIARFCGFFVENCSSEMYAHHALTLPLPQHFRNLDGL